jgi:hypothetical protein
MPVLGFFRKLAQRRVVLVALFVTLGFFVYFGLTGTASENAPTVFSLQLAFTEERFSEIVDQWRDADLLQIRKRNMWIDLLFPIAYAFCLSSMLAWSRLEPREKPAPTLKLLLTMPFVGGAFDWAENGLHLFLLTDASDYSASLIFLASIAASVKWLLVGVAFVVSVSAAVHRVWGIIVDRRF